MAHSNAEVIESTCDLLKSMDRQIGILKGAIAAIENARRATLMVTGNMPKPVHEDDVPAAKGFIKNLSDKITAAGQT